MKRSLAWIVVAALACGGEEPVPEAETEIGTETVPASVPAPEVEDGYLIVSVEEVRAWREAGEPVVVIDARDQVQFSREHIPDAVNVPYIDIRSGANLPGPETRIVLYCSDEDCPISRYAYDALRALGYRDLYDMREGIQGWKEAGFPTVVGEAAADSTG
jgi:rhodanese-related sulfurtransferase